MIGCTNMSKGTKCYTLNALRKLIGLLNRDAQSIEGHDKSTVTANRVCIKLYKYIIAIKIIQKMVSETACFTAEAAASWIYKCQVTELTGLFELVNLVIGLFELINLTTRLVKLITFLTVF